MWMERWCKLFMWYINSIIVNDRKIWFESKHDEWPASLVLFESCAYHVNITDLRSESIWLCYEQDILLLTVGDNDCSFVSWPSSSLVHEFRFSWTWNKWIIASSYVEMDNDNPSVLWSSKIFLSLYIWLIATKTIEDIIQNKNNFPLMSSLTTVMIRKYKCKENKIYKQNHWEGCSRSVIMPSVESVHVSQSCLNGCRIVEYFDWDGKDSDNSISMQSSVRRYSCLHYEAYMSTR